MSILTRRLSTSPLHDCDCTAELLEVDEAAKCLTQEDEKVIQTQKRVAQSSKAASDEIRKSYTEKKRTMVLAVAVAGAKGKGKKKKKDPQPVLPADMDMCEQAAAKILMPPNGAALWKSTKSSTRHSHVKPFPTCNRSVRRHGHSIALRAVITNAWRDWCCLSGVPFADAPIDNLMSLEELDAH